MPRAVTTRSRRNFSGPWRSDRFLLEYDDERSGTFEPLRFVPRGKTVVLGLVSSKRPELEKPDVLARRIEEASRLRAAGEPGAEPAVRVCVDDGREFTHGRRPVGQAAAGGGDGQTGVGLIRDRSDSDDGK